jgi:hypothetical protein
MQLSNSSCLIHFRSAINKIGLKNHKLIKAPQFDVHTKINIEHYMEMETTCSLASGGNPPTYTRRACFIACYFGQEHKLMRISKMPSSANICIQTESVNLKMAMTVKNVK